MAPVMIILSTHMPRQPITPLKSLPAVPYSPSGLLIPRIATSIQKTKKTRRDLSFKSYGQEQTPGFAKALPSAYKKGKREQIILTNRCATPEGDPRLTHRVPPASLPAPLLPYPGDSPSCPTVLQCISLGYVWLPQA